VRRDEEETMHGAHGRAPTVGSVMTPFPYFVDELDPVSKLEELMSAHGIRHVPVQRDGHVVGIVSERELHQLVNRSLPAVDKNRIRARDVLIAEPFVTEIDTPLQTVVREMAERHIGSAIVVRRGKLAGILSVTDVCRELANLLDELHPPPRDDEAA
jgi:CBS domain-containing protein